MKTLFTKVVLQFERISHPAGGWLHKSAAQRKRKSRKAAYAVLSPDCSNVRGISSRKGDARYTPAP